MKSDKLINSGLLYRTIGDHPRSLDCYLRAEKILEHSDDKSDLIPLLNNISVLYSDMDDKGKTIFYMQKSLALARKLNMKKKLHTS